MFGQTTIAWGPKASDLVHARTYACGHGGRHNPRTASRAIADDKLAGTQSLVAAASRRPYGGAAGMRNVADMLALDVSPSAKQDLDLGRREIEWPK
jgi:hypothetical protein